MDDEKIVNKAVTDFSVLKERERKLNWVNLTRQIFKEKSRDIFKFNEINNLLVTLEAPNITEFFDNMMHGNFRACIKILKKFLINNSFNKYIEDLPYKIFWRRLDFLNEEINNIFIKLKLTFHNEVKLKREQISLKTCGELYLNSEENQSQYNFDDEIDMKSQQQHQPICQTNGSLTLQKFNGNICRDQKIHNQSLDNYSNNNNNFNHNNNINYLSDPGINNTNRNNFIINLNDFNINNNTINPNEINNNVPSERMGNSSIMNRQNTSNANNTTLNPNVNSITNINSNSALALNNRLILTTLMNNRHGNNINNPDNSNSASNRLGRNELESDSPRNRSINSEDGDDIFNFELDEHKLDSILSGNNDLDSLNMLNDFCNENSFQNLCTNKNQINYPCERGGHTMTLDEKNSVIYLFGGWDGKKDLDDFWMFDIINEEWKLISLSTFVDNGPCARSCHRMVFDDSTQKIYVFGRIKQTSEEKNNKLHEYDTLTNKWTSHIINEEIDSNTNIKLGGPGQVYGHQMCIDSVNQKIYIFGGITIPEKEDNYNGTIIMKIIFLFFNL